MILLAKMNIYDSKNLMTVIYTVISFFEFIKQIIWILHELYNVCCKLLQTLILFDFLHWMFSINLLKSLDFIIFDPCKKVNWYLIWFFNNRLIYYYSVKHIFNKRSQFWNNFLYCNIVKNRNKRQLLTKPFVPERYGN